MLSNVNGYTTKPEWYVGKGSFGTVYKVEKGGQFYAMKVFQADYFKTEYKSRLDQEIKALQIIAHPNVVKLQDFGSFKENEFDYFYTVMDFVDGKPLTEFVGTLDEEHALNLIEVVLNTLSAIHVSGIIHRDLKPANIMIDKSGKPIVLDFGLAKLINYSSITQTGERVGTYYYMSPEQVTDSKNIDERSDYFAIGVILYELLTGVTPYDAANLPALIDQIKNQYPRNPSEKNPSITNQTENVILRLLEKEPHRRFQTVDETINALKEVPEDRPKKLDVSIKYYIRLQHTEKDVFAEGHKAGLVERVMFPANFFRFYHPTVTLLKNSGIIFTTDPATSRLPYSSFSKTKGVKELPYSSGDDVRPTQKKDFHSITQVQEYVKKVVDFQVANGVTELVAPFFFTKSSSDEWFNINLKLLKETTAYRDQHYSNMPLWAGISMNVDEWHDDDEKNKILNQYVKIAPDGFHVYGDPIGNFSNLVQLFHYSDFLQKLQDSSGVPVIACRVNGFGLILLSLGISGISSGIASLDNFKESILSDTSEGYSPEPRYYIPQMMGTVSLPKGVLTKLKEIEKSSLGTKLNCGCPYCEKNSSLAALPLKTIKLHFLYTRKQELAELGAIAPTDRLSYIEKRIEEAIKIASKLKKEDKKVGDFSHLSNWLSLVQQFKKH